MYNVPDKIPPENVSAEAIVPYAPEQDTHRKDAEGIFAERGREEDATQVQVELECRC